MVTQCWVDGAVVAIVVGSYDFLGGGGRYFWHSVRPHGIGGIVLQGPGGDVVRDSRVGSEKAE